MFSTSIMAGIAALATRIDGQPTEAVDGSWPEVRQATPTVSNTGVPTQTIAAGAEGFKFTPNNINATVGSILEFRFYPGGHTVARADFGFPCIPYEDLGVNRVGFFSGQISPQVISNNLPAYRVRVNNTDPIFFYCTAPTSCFQHHMIGVVNPNSTQNFDLQMQYAQSATFQMTPGDPWPSETESPIATGYPGGANSSTNHGNHHLSAGAIAGIAIGGTAVLVLAGAMGFLCGCRGALHTGYRRSAATEPPPPMLEAQYAPDGRSPRHNYPAHHNSGSIGSDPRTGSPHTCASSPPPRSPNQHTYLHPEGPVMGVSATGARGYYPTVSLPGDMQQQHRMHVAAVELPASSGPGSSPPPNYEYSASQPIRD
ncbi:hypothetical protein GE09DRAFT_310195 [Coniochaeta sp. 2T2.1]|nr:hypothetical protein GE09DRAFT_310195 [Coniochaeta sp. 2T2.1]